MPAEKRFSGKESTQENKSRDLPDRSFFLSSFTDIGKKKNVDKKQLN